MKKGMMIYMAKYREAVCMHYISFGECKKGREACHEKYCQKCDKYEPRAKVQEDNREKRKSKNSYKKDDIAEFKKNEKF
jgi:hypothetical protein